MESFTPWSLFIDLGIISVLLLLAKWMRVRIKLIQELFIPPGLLAGVMALAFGPQGTGWLPLSSNTGTYAGILIALVFGSLPLLSSGTKGEGKSVKALWAYSQIGMLLQWGVGGLLALLVLGKIWTLQPGFGVSMPGGFCGGHGTAAAIGQAFDRLGYPDIMTLAMTAATVGIIASVIVGLAIVKWATRKGHAAFLSDFRELPDELRTGLVPECRRQSMGLATCSAVSMDSLTLSMAIISVIAFAGYGISRLAAHFLPGFELPVFSCAFVAGIVLKAAFSRTGVSRYICRDTISHLSGAFTDFLVAFGIASINLSVVVDYVVPLAILLGAGLLVTFLYVILVARKMMTTHWFEKAIFTWGWYTGTMAMGIALLRIVDPKMQSRCLDGYAMAYLFIAPVEIALVTFAPAAFVSGYGIPFSAACLAAAAAVYLLARLKHWTRTPSN